MKIRVSDRAARDIGAAFDFIHRDSPRAARSIRSAVRRAILSLRTLPNRGRHSQWPGLRELPVPSTSYVIIYAVDADTVIIAHVRHTSQGDRP